MSKTVRIGVGSRWVGESCERAARGQLSFYPGEKRSVGAQVAETTGDVNSCGFWKLVFEVGFGKQVRRANI